ncbi:MAG: OmpA family protein [Flammeovirgaceae bacterium]
MNRALSVLFILIIFSLSVNAQRLIRFRDDFNNNESNWSEGSNEKTSTKVVYGHYELYHKRSSGGYTFYRDFFMDYHADFYFESKIMQTIGADNHGYGLLWGGKGGNDCYNFLISSNGYFTIGEWKGGKYTALQAWTKIDNIKPKFQYNLLAVKRRANQLSFYVNGKEVHVMNDRAFMGFKFGFNLKAAMKVKSDYLVLEYTAKEINLVKNARQGFVKENLGSLVNSSYIEKSPKISHDGKTLYFTRADHPSNTSGKDDAWYAEEENGNWGKAKKMVWPINNDGHNFVVSITPDNNTLLVGNTYNSDGTDKGAGVSITHRTAKGWEIPKEQKIEDYYNDNKYVNYCLAPNRKVLIMAVQRKDSYGDQDLCYSELKSDGTWTKPKNMGPVINTFAKEFAPFITADGRTMYFASQGHPGYGSADIFVTKRIGSGWTKWTKPENLGPEINTNLWDAYFTVPAKGNYAYLVSKKGSLGKEDIFRIKLQEEEEEEVIVMDEVEEPSRDELFDLTQPEEGEIEADPNEGEIVINTGDKSKEDKPSFVPDPVVVIYGKILDANTNKPLEARITYEDLDSKEELGIASSNPTTGDYKLVLPFGEHYGIVAEEDKHISASANIKVTGSGEYIEIEKNLYLVPLEVGKTVRVNNVFFARSKPELLPKSFPELDRIVELMNTHPRMEIELGGHTDGIGNPVLLMKLSNDRVKAVKRYLVSKGISDKRIGGRGYGRSRPIAPNNTEENRKKNRRVEFKITKL